MDAHPTHRTRGILLFLLAAALVGCDHGTKALAVAELADGAAVAVPGSAGLVALRFAPNPDTAFSLLARFGIPHGPGLLLALASFAVLLLLVTWVARTRRGAATWLDHLGFALVLAGAAGNAIDRAVRGYVVDFVHIAPWPVFNVADVAVVVGMGLLVLASLRATGAAAAPPPA